MGKCEPCQQTRNVKCHKTVSDNKGSSAVLAVRRFLRNTLITYETCFKKLIHGKNTRHNKHDKNRYDDTFSVKLIPVSDWPEHAIPSFNSQIDHKKYGNFSHCEQQISVGEQAAKNLTT